MKKINKFNKILLTVAFVFLSGSLVCVPKAHAAVSSFTDTFSVARYLNADSNYVKFGGSSELYASGSTLGPGTCTTSNTYAKYRTSDTFTSPNYSVNMYISGGATAYYHLALFARVQSEINNYFVNVEFGNKVFVGKTVNGSADFISIYAVPGVGDTLTLKVEGSTLSVLWGGVVRGTYTDTSNTFPSAGYAGFGMGSMSNIPQSGAASLGCLSSQAYDNFSVSTNTPPTHVSGPTVSYQNSRFRTGVNTTWSVQLRYDDAEQTGANALSWQLRTASGGGGTLITSGTTTSGQTNTYGPFPYNQTGIVEGTGNTVYLRVYDGVAYADEWFTWVYRDTVNPTSATNISHTPSTVGSDNIYTVTFTPNDAASTNTNELIGYVYTGPNGTGTYLTGTSATTGQPKTTGSINDAALVTGANTRYLRTCDGANNCSDTSFTVTKNSPPSVSSPTKNSITTLGANLGGNITSDNGSAITGRGVCVGTSLNPTLGGNCLSTAGTTGVFSVLFSNLSSGTLYHYRAYGTNSANTSYTADDTFTTVTLASGCTFPVSGDVTIGTSCNIPTDGLTVSTTQIKLVGSDTGSIQMNADMTINPGSVLVWGPGKQIIRAPGVTLFNATGTQITQKYICLYDPDADGVPNDYMVTSQGGTAVLQDTSGCGANYIRPNTLNSAFLNFNGALKDLAPNDNRCFDLITCI